jgi:hypothetical protein
LPAPLFTELPNRSPTASLTALWSPVPVTTPLPMLRGCATRDPALTTARSAGRRSPICPTLPASPARRRAGTRHPQDPTQHPPVIVVRPPCRWPLWDERLDHLPHFVGERCSLGSYRGRLRSSAEVASGRPLSAEGTFGASARLLAAGGNGLVRPSPQCPSISWTTRVDATGSERR